MRTTSQHIQIEKSTGVVSSSKIYVAFFESIKQYDQAYASEKSFLRGKGNPEKSGK